MWRLLLLALAISFSLSGNALDNKDTESLIQQSYEQTTAGNLDDALVTLQQAAQEAPDSSLVRTRLGGIRVLRKEYSKGIKDFQQAIMLDQKNTSAFIGMAVAYLHMGQYNLAQAALEEAGKLDPTKKPEISKVQAWIEQRTSKATISTH
ncbi:MAG: tetratricopeptide repeat protein [Candidatus Thiodiazotropha sp. (ex Lucinoma borealis)]|nr:tetratricopeptide repeat protein [Candidatus Thiodiazotropha sp. (ex Lucinoma borealis)]